CVQHRVAGRQRVHVRARLREDRAGKAYRAVAGPAAREELACARLLGDVRRHDSRAVHALEYRAQRGHDVPGVHQPAADRCRTSSRRIGAYLLWTTFAASCMTSTLFMTACAPNFLAIDFIRKIAHVELAYKQ